MAGGSWPNTAVEHSNRREMKKRKASRTVPVAVTALLGEGSKLDYAPFVERYNDVFFAIVHF
jgi:hypothetical protein